MSTVVDRMNQLESLGVRITRDHEYRGDPKIAGSRHRVELEGTVEHVFLPLAAEEWIGMCMRDPLPGIPENYIGPCCGNTGLVQDITNGAFRDGGRFSADELATIGPLLRGHDGWEAFAGDFDLDVALEPKRWEHVKPPEGHVWYTPEGEMPEHLSGWDKICIVHAALEPALKLPRDERPGRQVHPTVEQRHPGTTAFGRLAHTLQYLNFGVDLFASPPEGEHFEYQTDEIKERMRREWQTHLRERQVVLARLVPALRDAINVLEEMRGDEAIEGVALVRPGTDEVLESGRGLCVYATRDDAQYVLGKWAKWETENSARRKHGEDEHEPEFVNPFKEAEIVPIRVSVREGLWVER